MNALAQNVTKLSNDYEALKKKCRQQQAEIEALTTQFVRVADENNRLKDQIEMLKKGKVEYGYDTTKTS